jgi:hypothetical protein
VFLANHDVGSFGAVVVKLSFRIDNSTIIHNRRLSFRSIDHLSHVSLAIHGNEETSEQVFFHKLPAKRPRFINPTANNAKLDFFHS